jgi:hypothetical protein
LDEYNRAPPIPAAAMYWPVLLIATAVSMLDAVNGVNDHFFVTTLAT